MASSLMTGAMLLAAASNAGPMKSYVSGEYSQTLQNYGRAAADYGDALAAVPDDIVLRRKAFDTALTSGNMDEALSLARSIAARDDSVPPVNQLLVIDAIHRSDWKAADSILKRMPAVGVDALLLPLMKSWVALGAKDMEGARSALDPLGRNDSFVAFKTQQLAWLACVSGDWAAAKQAFTVLTQRGTAIAGTTNLLGFAAALSQLGEKDAARALLATGSDSRTSVRLLLARERLDRDGKISPPLSSPQQGMAAALSIVSAELSAQSVHGPAVNLGQMAAWLAPERAEYRIILAEVLAAAGRNSEALMLLDAVPDSSDTKLDSALARARLLLAKERWADGQALLDQLAKAYPQRAEPWLAKGDGLRAQEQNEQAAAAYGEAIARLGEPWQKSDWSAFFSRAAAYERAKQWDRAEADLKQALVLRPDDPTLLNYLGYSWLEQGRNYDEASAMIAKALEKRPGDGAIIDSLGWSEYLAGRHARAIELLEQAIEAVPGDPTVNEHLGDAYWRAGRIIEARHRWSAALDSDPDAAQKSRLEVKLQSGLVVADGKRGG